LTLVVLSTVRTPWEGIAYIFVFGLGSILGMVALGILMSVPFVFSVSQGRSLQVGLQGCASVASIGFGLALLLR
jgi:sulfite exporter TauE/SafE